jgi:hypothetical protein
MADPKEIADVGTSARSVSDAALDKLFADGERWGWEHRDVELLYEQFPTPEPQNPTKAPGVAPSSPRGSDLREMLPSSVGDYLRKYLTFLFFGLYWPVWLIKRARRKRRKQGEAEAKLKGVQKEREALTQRFEAELMAWQKAKHEWDAKEQRRLETLPMWGAVGPDTRSRRLDIYGGTVSGWQSLTVTLGASMLGSQESIIVLDLSESGVSAALLKVAAQRKSTRVCVLPREADGFDPFAGLSATVAKDMLVEAFGSAHDDGPLGDRIVIDRILTAICAVLEPELTFARLHSALLLLLRELPSADAASSPVTDAEESRIADLFGDESRDVMRPHLVELEAQFAPLRSLGRAADSSSDGAAFECVGIAISREGGALANELLVRVLVQKTIHDLRVAASGDSRVLMVIGADRLKLRDIERLDDLTASVGARVVYLFRHVRGEVLDALGGGDAVAGVMRLGNPSEAEAIAKFIGSAYRFELTQLTDTKTTSWSENFGTSETRRGIPSLSESWGKVEQLALARAKGETRVHEYVVEPDAFKKLLDTGILLVEFGTEGDKVQVRSANCQPVLAGHPRTSALPFAT